MSEKFGIFAQDLKIRVTNNIKQAGKVTIIPCSMGFQQQDKTYANEWVDVKVFAGQFQDLAIAVQKGDQIKVNGRMTMSQYNDKKSWQILCDEFEIIGKTAEVKQIETEDVPF
jgi:single-stranded DNA-binding protein